MNKIVKILSVGLVALLSGCGGNKGTRVANEGFSTSMAQETLTDILIEQERLFEKAEGVSESDVRSLRNRFKQFTKDNPENLDALILYGKFLYLIEGHEEAFEVFTKIDKKHSDIAVVKQHLASYMAEGGKPDLALPYICEAIDLDPKQALYHAQLGELLYTYRDFYIASGVYDVQEWDELMLGSFRSAHELSPLEWTYGMRYGQAYYDLNEPRWEDALGHWQRLERMGPPSEFDLEQVYLNQGYALMELGEKEKALEKLNKVFMPELEHNRRVLIERIENGRF